MFRLKHFHSAYLVLTTYKFELSSVRQFHISLLWMLSSLLILETMETLESLERETNAQIHAFTNQFSKQVTNLNHLGSFTQTYYFTN